MSLRQYRRPYRLRVERLDGSTEDVVRTAYTAEIARSQTLANARRVRVLSCDELSPDEYRRLRADAARLRRESFDRQLNRSWAAAAARRKAASAHQAAPRKGVRPC
jgi:hypothetical protein